MTAYDPALIERLVAEAREDDARMTPSPWICEADHLYHHSEDDGTILLASFKGEATVDEDAAVARTRNNLSAMADQLEAAKREVETWQQRAGVALRGFAETNNKLEAMRVRLVDADTEIAAANTELSMLRELRSSAQAEVERLGGCSRSWAQHAESITAERDALRAEVDRMRAMRSALATRVGHLEHVGPCRSCGDRAQDLRDILDVGATKAPDA